MPEEWELEEMLEELFESGSEDATVTDIPKEDNETRLISEMEDSLERTIELCEELNGEFPIFEFSEMRDQLKNAARLFRIGLRYKISR